MGGNGGQFLTCAEPCTPPNPPCTSTHIHTHKHYHGFHHLQLISHLRGAVLKDVRLNRRDVRVDLVGRGKLVRGLVRRKKEDDTELGVALPYSPNCRI
jgi:hypothetical protein